jgi:hypothetical protein
MEVLPQITVVSRFDFLSGPRIPFCVSLSFAVFPSSSFADRLTDGHRDRSKEKKLDI